MSEFEVAYHKRWLGMLEPIEGLVVSVPVLVEAECMEKRDPELSRQLAQEAKRADESQRLNDEATALTRVIGKTAAGHVRRAIVSLDDFLSRVLGLTPELFARSAELPADLELYVPEGGETIRPTLALKKRGGAAAPAAAEASEGVPDVSTPQSRAGEGFVMLLSDQPGVDLDAMDRREGSWAHPPLAKFDRLLRATRVPIGLITNREELRLVYAPHGESSGVLTFRVGDLAAVGGRDLLDAFVMLLSKERFFVVDKERQLPALLRKSRAHQANVTTELADQVFEALTLLLRGFERAAERDGVALLEQPLARGGDYVYGGLLTVLLRLVFLLYAEDRDLLPTKHAPYATDLSLLSLFGQLQADHAAFPDTMARRFGAWPRLLAVFRAVYFGARWGTVVMPPRRGELFDPTRYPFLEGWGPDGGAPRSAKERALLRVPTIDDETIYRVLDKLLVLDGQRLSYRALDVEQIGSVYEGLIGYSVVRLDGPAVCLKPERVWVSASKCRAEAANRSVAWLQETAGVAKKRATQLASELSKCKTAEAALEVLSSERVKGSEPKAAGEYVLQPGAERRRTSSHYTPKSLTAPIVKKTLEPLLRALGEAPASDQLLALKICDPAMGSGAFLVETCRFLADQVVAAWSREGTLEGLRGKTDDVVLHARRLVAQRCLYGVDLNPFAVTLARLSMWLVTLAKDAPFTFVDHALRHGDSLVGLTLEQLRAFHWRPPAQLELTSVATEVDAALEEARGYRERILALAEAGPEATEEKERLLRDAELALERARVVGDLVLGAFFVHSKDKDRERARKERLESVRAWFDGDGELPADLKTLREGLSTEQRHRIHPFHWSIEFPEVFYQARPDPLQHNEVTGTALMDAFVGNPPFLGGTMISTVRGPQYLSWLSILIGETGNRADLSCYFFRRGASLLGSHGTLGLVATNTIHQGDTRERGLAKLIPMGYQIYDATNSMPWPGTAAVRVAIVHAARGHCVTSLGCQLNGVQARQINSRLEPKREVADPHRLFANRGLSYLGVKTYGSGFIVDKTERNSLVRKRAANADRLLDYLGGDEINTSPMQANHRFAIQLTDLELADCEQLFPELIAIVRERVKPERDELADTAAGMWLKRNWWRYFRPRNEMYARIAALKQCLVSSRHTKYLCFAFQPCERVFSEALNVFAFSDNAHFAVLQSRIHEHWARVLSSSLGDTLRYNSSDCFETFPFPNGDTLVPTSSVNRVGEALYEARGRYMVGSQQGLTDTYNGLKDQDNLDPRIVELRRLHEAMDRAVLDAYGWTDIEVPPYGTPVTADERRALERFEDEVIDRLFALNAERAEDERRRGIAKSPAASASVAANDTEGDEDTQGAEDAPAAKAPKSSPRGKAAKGPGLKKTSAPPPKPKRTAAGTRKR